jgi:uncharacterized repeat protein (TIGR01451 family)
LKKFVKAVLAGTGALLCLAAAWAQNAEVESRLSVQRVAAQADGRESLGPATSVKPGDVLEYSSSYRNVGKAPARSLQATLPIPAGTEFLPGSTRPVAATASTDGMNFAPLPLKRKLKQADGREVEQLVPTAEYRALRWAPVDLPPGQTLQFVARVRVVDDRAPASAPKK